MKGFEMRRKEKEISDKGAVEAIIAKSTVCRIGLCDEGVPYLVPVCFGYDGRSIYFHSALAGRKGDIIQRKGLVCFEMEADVALVPSDVACDWGVRYRSIIGYGRAELVRGAQGKREALKVIMKHYKSEAVEFPDERLGKTAVVRIDIESMSAKQNGY